MASRHEEKYIIDYKQYAMVKSRIQGVLTPDIHGDHGTYLITSLYYDDHLDNALAEKLVAKRAADAAKVLEKDAALQAELNK